MVEMSLLERGGLLRTRGLERMSMSNGFEWMSASWSGDRGCAESTSRDLTPSRRPISVTHPLPLPRRFVVAPLVMVSAPYPGDEHGDAVTL
jgi:hypothetical protein